MPSSLARVLSRALVFSTSLPVSVYGTDTTGTPREAFLGSLDSTGLWGSSPSSTSLGIGVAFIPTTPSYRFEPIARLGTVYLSPSLLVSKLPIVVQEC